MTYRPYRYEAPAARTAIDLGPRLQADIKRRIRELEGRLLATMTRRDWAELHRLRNLLQIAKTGGEP